MTALDPATEAHIERLLEQAPPPPPEAVALWAKASDPSRPREQDARSYRHALYRHWDAAGVLLYVGMSSDPESRNRSHRNSSKWWKYRARETVEWLPDFDATRAAELHAITTELPIFNNADTAPGTAARRRTYLAVQETYIPVRNGQ